MFTQGNNVYTIINQLIEVMTALLYPRQFQLVITSRLTDVGLTLLHVFCWDVDETMTVCGQMVETVLHRAANSRLIDISSWPIAELQSEETLADRELLKAAAMSDLTSFFRRLISLEIKNEATLLDGGGLHCVLGIGISLAGLTGTD